MSRIHIYGAGGHAKVVADIIADAGYELGNVYADGVGEDTFLGRQVLHRYDGSTPVVICVGDCRIRRLLAERTAAPAPPLVHSSATVSPSATLGEGIIVMQGAVVQAAAQIGRHCIVNTHASVDHDCRIADYVHIAPGATVCGGCSVGEGTWLGAGTVVKQGVSVGRNCMVGAGSVLLRDLPDNVVAYGNPCHVVKMRE